MLTFAPKTARYTRTFLTYFIPSVPWLPASDRSWSYIECKYPELLYRLCEYSRSDDPSNCVLPWFIVRLYQLVSIQHSDLIKQKNLICKLSLRRKLVFISFWSNREIWFINHVDMIRKNIKEPWWIFISTSRQKRKNIPLWNTAPIIGSNNDSFIVWNYHRVCHNQSHWLMTLQTYNYVTQTKSAQATIRLQRETRYIIPLIKFSF